MSAKGKRDHLRSWNKHNGAGVMEAVRTAPAGTPSGKHIMSRATKDGEVVIVCYCGACSTGVKTTGKAKIGGKAA